MNRVVIESPYASESTAIIAANIAYARRALLHSLDQGEAPFASHLLYTKVLDDTVASERLRGIQAGYEWASVADLIAFYVDLGWSPGMIKALKIARLLKRRIAVRRVVRDNDAEPREPLEVRNLLGYWRDK